MVQCTHHPQRIFLIFIITASYGSAGNLKRALSFSLSSRLNQTGHVITQLSMDKSLLQFPDQWNLKINQTLTEGSGMQTLHLDTVFISIPPRPIDYEYFPGVGYYKFHSTFADGFDDASSKCGKEGGHLAIVNSESEHEVLLTLFRRFPESTLKTSWAFIGFHDRIKEGEYLSIFGQPLNTTGFLRWAFPNLPDDYKGGEDCGSIFRSGGFNDVKCNDTLPFFCEYDMTWG